MKKWVRVLADFPDPEEGDTAIYLSDRFILAGIVLIYPITFILGGMLL